MSYREKTAWLSLIAMAVAFGPYFTLLAASPHPGGSLASVRHLGLFAVAAGVQVLILGVGHLLLGLGSRQETRRLMDEQDRAIMRRALSFAYYVLITGMIVVGCIMPFEASGWTIINAALFMIVAAEVVHYGIVVVSYRRQA